MSVHKRLFGVLASILLLTVGNGAALQAAAAASPTLPEDAVHKGVTRRMIITSDPHYPWFRVEQRKGEMGSGLKNGHAVGLSQPATGEDIEQAKQVILDQYRSIQNWRASASGGVDNNPVIINGDMTAFGREDEWSYIYGVLNGIMLSNWSFGLGDLDYKDNVDGCQDNVCAMLSMGALTSHMGGSNMDYGRGALRKSNDKVTDYVTLAGSFAYYKDVGKVRYIQLNLDPSYTSYITSPYAHVGYHIESPINNGWLGTVLAQARSEGKSVFIGMHDPVEWTKSQDPIVQNMVVYFRQLIKVYGVSAIFAGDNGSGAGRYEDIYDGVPVFLSGSAVSKDYLVVDIAENDKTFRVWKVSNNSPQAAEDIGVLPLKRFETVPAVDEHDAVGSWGSWGNEAFCDVGKYINGFGVKAEKYQGDNDDSAVNGIIMACGPGYQALRSKEGAWGDETANVYCQGRQAVVGFQLKMEDYQGDGDDTAVDSVKLVCEGGQYIASPYDTNYGEWKKTYLCPAGMVAIGFETRVEDNQGNGDDTALNGMRMKCGPKP